ncbi:hypothetical protein T02_5983 [Trichinella nativa]|uniref:Uncharacterized protein n=1 Tax=Trichinella nativa TaxID=6335 RepID=A0A0V1LT14_9BILA|nr:hypothetical protein T02_7308 [Trichinella nativa]KRZ49605.1 hypothetical protein T02_4876 [Trichinella nativa]KRZ62254.1 hypothetical protein T02_5983 [Trichinella nativa]
MTFNHIHVLTCTLFRAARIATRIEPYEFSTSRYMTCHRAIRCPWQIFTIPAVWKKHNNGMTNV